MTSPAPPPAQLNITVGPTANLGPAYHVAHIPRGNTSTPFVASSNLKLLDEVNKWIKDEEVKGRPPGTILFHQLDLKLPKVEVIMSDTRELASVQRCRLNAKYMIRVLTLPNYHSMFVRLRGSGHARRFQAWYGGELGFTDDIIASESGLDSRGDNVSGLVSTRKRKRTAIVECNGSLADNSLTNLSTSNKESDEDDREEDVIPRASRNGNASDEPSRKVDDQIVSRPRRSIQSKRKTGINHHDDSDTTDGRDPLEEGWDPKEDNISLLNFIPLGRRRVPQVPKLRRTMPIRASSPGKHPRNPPQVEAHSQIFRQRPISIKRSSSPEIKHAPSPELEEISGEHWTSIPRHQQSKFSSTPASSLSTSQEDEVTFHFHTTRTNTTVPRPMSSCSTMLSFFDEVLSAWTTTFPQSQASEASVGGGGQGGPKGVLTTFEGGKREVYVPWKSADAWGAMMRGVRRGGALEVDVRCVGEGV